jgi:uncharacterized protein
MPVCRSSALLPPSRCAACRWSARPPTRFDRLTLKGWFIPTGGQRAIIMVFGGDQPRVDNLVDSFDLARDLHASGFDILLFDLRGRGQSQGNARTLMNDDRDLGGALDYVESRGFADSQIGLLGFCSGAANSAIFASHNQVGALVLVGCFASVERMVDSQAAQRHIPRFLVDMFLPGLRFTTFFFYGYHEVAPLTAVETVEAPIFFIHEQYDELTNLADTELLYHASPDPGSQLWEEPGALHSEGYRTHPAEFVSKVSSFFDLNLS